MTITTSSDATPRLLCSAHRPGLRGIADDPSQPEIGDMAFTHHLRHSRKRAGSPGERVKRPGHFLLRRLAADNAVEAGGVLHERYDLPRYVPGGYR